MPKRVHSGSDRDDDKQSNNQENSSKKTRTSSDLVRKNEYFLCSTNQRIESMFSSRICVKNCSITYVRSNRKTEKFSAKLFFVCRTKGLSPKICSRWKFRQTLRFQSSFRLLHFDKRSDRFQQNPRETSSKSIRDARRISRRFRVTFFQRQKFLSSKDNRKNFSAQREKRFRRIFLLRKTRLNGKTRTNCRNISSQN